VQSWRDPVKAWQYACSNHQLLPAAHKQLLQTLGCDSRTILWLAAALARRLLDDDQRIKVAAGLGFTAVMLRREVQCAIGLTKLLQQKLHMSPFEEFLSQQQQQQHQQQHQQQAAGSARRQQAEVQLQVFPLLSKVVLYLTAHHPTDSADWLTFCLNAIQLSAGSVAMSQSPNPNNWAWQLASGIQLGSLQLQPPVALRQVLWLCQWY
jgi:hypothetical protein